jgi:hypothetical protein
MPWLLLSATAVGQTGSRNRAGLRCAREHECGSRPTCGEAPVRRLSENLMPRRAVSSGSSVWLSVGGGLTLYSPVELVWV